MRIVYAAHPPSTQAISLFRRGRRGWYRKEHDQHTAHQPTDSPRRATDGPGPVSTLAASGESAREIEDEQTPRAQRVLAGDTRM
jgi:hypothetical protein